MPYVTCPDCGLEQLVPKEMDGLEVGCKGCQAEFVAGDGDRPTMASRPARRHRPVAIVSPQQGLPIWLSGAVVIPAICSGFAGAMVGVFLSQYFPIFGNPFAMIGEPWSPARQSLIGIHVLVFGPLGAACGGGFAALLAYQSRAG